MHACFFSTKDRPKMSVKEHPDPFGSSSSRSSSASLVAACQRVRKDRRLWKRDNLYLPYEREGQANYPVNKDCLRIAVSKARE